MRRLLRRITIPLLYLGSRKLRAHELASIRGLRGALPEAGQRILDKQVDEFELVQRGSNGKSVMIHFDPRTTVPRFESRGWGEQVAQVTLRAVGLEKPLRIRCELSFGDGLFREWSFNRLPPKEFKGEFEVAGVDLQIDPMVPRHRTPVRYLETVPPALGDLGATDVQPPANLEEQQRFLKKAAGAALPEDYLALLRQTNGFRIGDCEFLGTEARYAVRSDANLWLLAICPVDVALCVAEGSGAPELFLWNEVDDSLETAGASFMDGLRKMLKAVAESGDE